MSSTIKILALAGIMAVSAIANAGIVSLTPNTSGSWNITGSSSDPGLYLGDPNYPTLGNFRSVLKFDLSSIPAGVAAANLTMNGSWANPNPFGDHWFVLEAFTYNNSGPITSTDATTTSVAQVGGVYKFHFGSGSNVIDVTSAVQGALASDFISFRLVETDAAGVYQVFTEATDSATIFDTPTMNINVVPEPTSLALLGLGMITLLRRRRN